MDKLIGHEIAISKNAAIGCEHPNPLELIDNE
jgi:hypothetical protein